MEKKYCKSCAYFKQHYGLDDKKLFALYCGHCMKAKSHKLAKGKKPDSIACALYVPAEPDESRFASREYLSKMLLEYVLKLPLLPEIEEK